MAAAVGGARAVAADIEAYQEYDERLEASKVVSALTPDLFGDKVNLFNRQTEFSNVDISLTGNNKLPVELRRVFRVERDPVDAAYRPFGGFGNWDLDVPHIVGTFDGHHGWAQNRCSTPSVPQVSTPFRTMDIWKGNTIHLPGRGNLKMMRSTADSKVPTNLATNPWTTDDFSAIECTNMLRGLPGQGFILRTIDGFKYTFNVGLERSSGRMTKSWGTGAWPIGTVTTSRIRTYILASSIEDRFGNKVTYDYHPTSGLLRSITSSDGRSITLTDSNGDGRIDSAKADNNAARTWSYGYANGRLSTVTQPDAGEWSYAYAGNTYIDPGTWDALTGPTCRERAPYDPGTFNLTVTHPSGAKGLFEFTHQRRFRSGVSRSYCQIDYLATQPGEPDIYALVVSNYYDVFALTRKTISGPALTSGT